MISLSSVAYFLRHRRRDAVSEHGADRPPALAAAGKPDMRGHALLRSAFWPCWSWSCRSTSFCARHDTLRADITSEGLSSLSPQTRKLLRELKPKHPVQVDAYISDEGARELRPDAG